MKWRFGMRRILLFAVLGSAASLPAADPLPPKPGQYVTDGAGILTPQTRATLNSDLDSFERETSNQVLVVTMPRVPEGYVMEDFTQRTAESWGVGRKENNNGAVLFVFPQDRKTRIEVGYGLEGVLTDALSKRIIENEIVPAFRAGDYDAGITRGAEAIRQAIRGEYRGTGRTVADASRYDGQPEIPAIMILIFLIIFFFVMIQTWRAARKGAYYGPNGKRNVWFDPFGGSGSSGGGFGSGSSGGSSGGGFSGGGGSFGGGGASGGW